MHCGWKINDTVALKKVPSFLHVSHLSAPTPYRSILRTLSVPDHDGGRPIEVNICILITHMVYL